MSTNPFLRGSLITELDSIFDGVINANYYRTRNHRFEVAVANAVSEYTDLRIARYDTEVINIERKRITSLEKRVTDIERRLTSLEQSIGAIAASVAAAAARPPARR